MCRYILIIALGLGCLSSSSGAAANNRLRCDRPGDLPNGSFRLKRTFMRAFCNNGYQLQGLRTIGCVHGKWDGEKPVCASMFRKCISISSMCHYSARAEVATISSLKKPYSNDGAVLLIALLVIQVAITQIHTLFT